MLLGRARTCNAGIPAWKLLHLKLVTCKCAWIKQPSHPSTENWWPGLQFRVARMLCRELEVNQLSGELSSLCRCILHQKHVCRRLHAVSVPLLSRLLSALCAGTLPESWGQAGSFRLLYHL